MIGLVVTALLALQAPSPGDAPVPESAGDVPTATAGAPPVLVDEGPPPAALTPEAAPAEPRAPEPEPGQPSEEQCLALVQAKQVDAARACYAERALLEGEAGERARALAEVVATLSLDAPGDVEGNLAPPRTSLPFSPPVIGDLVKGGKAELIGVSTLAGASVAGLGASSVLAFLNASGPAAGLLLMAPVIGGIAGLGLSTAAVVLWPEMTAGDANAMRAFLLLGGYDAVMLAAGINASPFNGVYPSIVIPLGMAATITGAAAAGAAVAAFTDLPEVAGSLAVSGGLWASVVGILVADMFQAYKFRPQDSVWLLTATGNLGFAGGLLAAQVVPMTRAETWALDVGGGVGLLAGAALATWARAPNPVLGWGSMAAGTVVGMGAGFVVARFIPQWLGTTPAQVTVAPVVLPDVDDVSGDSMRLGAAVTGRF